MARPGRPLAWAAAALAVPVAVAFSPVQPPGLEHWEPLKLVAAHPVHSGLAPVVAKVPAPGSRAGSIAVRAALTRLGDPYVWAAAGPNAFDCSGLVVWSFQQAGVPLPHSSQLLATGGRAVPLEQIQPGDVITFYPSASHVALYVGDHKMVHASTYGVPVAVVPMNNSQIHNVRRYG